MKYAIVSFMLLMLSGCGSSGTVAREETTIVTGYDFSEYTAQGFLITPEQYLGTYESMGMITVTMWPEVRKEVRIRYKIDNGQRVPVEEETFVVGELNVKKAIDEIYEQAKGMGADAITRFNVTYTSRLNGDLIVPGTEISGFAIKRLGKEVASQ